MNEHTVQRERTLSQANVDSVQLRADEIPSDDVREMVQLDIHEIDTEREADHREGDWP